MLVRATVPGLSSAPWIVDKYTGGMNEIYLLLGYFKGSCIEAYSRKHELNQINPSIA